MKNKFSELEAKLASQPFTDEEKKKLYAWEDEGSYFATAPAGFYWMEVRLSKQSGKYHVDLFERKSISGTFNKTESKVKNSLEDAMNLGNSIAESFINDEEMRVASKGPRGGEIIGKTKSGKPIYDQHDHPAHKGFSKSDHHDAAQAHFGLYEKNRHGPSKPGDTWETNKPVQEHHYGQFQKHFDQMSKTSAKTGKHPVTIKITSKNVDALKALLDLLKKYEKLEGDESVDWEMTS